VPPPRGPGVARTRATILRAARCLLFDEGLEALSHRRVAELAGVGRATVYRHWPDRVRLLRDACATEMGAIHTTPTGELREDLLAELEVLRVALAELGVGRVLVSCADRGPWEPELAEAKTALVREGVSTIRAILVAAQLRGLLGPDHDVDEAVSRVVGPIAFRYLALDQVIPSEAVEREVDAFLVGHLPYE
jgi:AcrR family transcriptional regulator